MPRLAEPPAQRRQRNSILQGKCFAGETAASELFDHLQPLGGYCRPQWFRRFLYLHAPSIINGSRQVKMYPIYRLLLCGEGQRGVLFGTPLKSSIRDSVDRGRYCKSHCVRRRNALSSWEKPNGCIGAFLIRLPLLVHMKRLFPRSGKRVMNYCNVYDTKHSSGLRLLRLGLFAGATIMPEEAGQEE